MKKVSENISKNTTPLLRKCYLFFFGRRLWNTLYLRRSSAWIPLHTGGIRIQPWKTRTQVNLDSGHSCVRSGRRRDPVPGEVSLNTNCFLYAVASAGTFRGEDFQNITEKFYHFFRSIKYLFRPHYNLPL